VTSTASFQLWKAEVSCWFNSKTTINLSQSYGIVDLILMVTDVWDWIPRLAAARQSDRVFYLSSPCSCRRVKWSSFDDLLPFWLLLFEKSQTGLKQVKIDRGLPFFGTRKTETNFGGGCALLTRRLRFGFSTGSRLNDRTSKCLSIGVSEVLSAISYKVSGIGSCSIPWVGLQCRVCWRCGAWVDW